MGYRFPLASVLRVRERAPEQEEQVLMRILAELARLRGMLAQTERDLLDAGRARYQAFAARALPAMHLHASYGAAQALRARGQQLQQQIESFEQLRLQQMMRYEDAYRRREVLVSLRDEQKGAWMHGQTKREERAADEAFLARRHREQSFESRS